LGFKSAGSLGSLLLGKLLMLNLLSLNLIPQVLLLDEIKLLGPFAGEVL